MNATDVLKRLAYGTAFVVGVPSLLALWAMRSEPMVRLPAPGNSWIGAVLTVAGLSLLLAGMAGLVVHGGGLPMNAFPPPRFVRRGVYAWVRDPIYLGFGLMVLGVSLGLRSPSGLWLVTPVTWLAMAALVFGYERHDLRTRFPDALQRPPVLSVPPPGAEPPDAAERLGTLVWVLGPWLLAYYAVQGLGRPPDAFGTGFAFESRWPVWQWAEVPYASAYLFVPLTVVVARTRSALRSFAVSGWAATAFVTLCWLVIPVVADHRPFEPDSWAGRLLAAEMASSNGVAAFPAFHVLWPMLAARAWAAGRSRATAAVSWAWAALIAWACLATGHHSLLDVAAGAALYLPFRDVGRTWDTIRKASEAVANSWREWRAGPVRFINHGLYAGLAGAVGVTLAGVAAGPGMEAGVAWVAAWAMIGAGTYAQVIEGSSRLLRPFGWYGGVVGGLLGIASSPLVGGAVLPLLGGFAVASPWIQALGRFRCLVQGCCHGAPSTPAAGIRYRHPRSRVCHLAELKGVPLFPTPLYSILGNVVIGALLLRLRVLGASPTLVLGVYLALSACARFVEESYRGEPQTPVVAGLRLYQWFAVGTLLVGVVATMVPTPPPPVGLTAPSGALLGVALAFFVAASAAMGLDFPSSNLRFSRLAEGDPPGDSTA